MRPKRQPRYQVGQPCLFPRGEGKGMKPGHIANIRYDSRTGTYLLKVQDNKGWGWHPEQDIMVQQELAQQKA